MKILIITLIVAGCFFLLLRLFLQNNVKRVANDMTRYVDIVKFTLYRILQDKFLIDYSEKGKDFAGAMAATIVNEFFDCHKDITKEFFKENKKNILNEIALFAQNHSDLKRPITDALRVHIQTKYTTTGTVDNNFHEAFQKAIDYGIFIKDGESPKPDAFREMALALAGKYKINRNKGVNKGV